MAADETKHNTDKRVALVLQGGGALGAYQAGVYQALEEHGLAPGWVVGTSIGAINGAIIAGNPADRRVERLKDFWRTVSRPAVWGAKEMPQIQSFWSVLQAMLVGQPEFFVPRWVDPFAAWAAGSAERASFYDTDGLRATLQRLIDFGVINAGTVRLSLGAVSVCAGELVYFDNTRQQLGAEHVMASGALPPGFPAVRVDGRLYWDGGIYSNTPLALVLEEAQRVDTLCFMVDLWSPAGPEPRSIPEVLTRHKDIMYASRSREHIEACCRAHNAGRAVRALYERLPEKLKHDPELRALADLGCHTTVNIVRLVHSGQDGETALKDADFSQIAIEARWAQGYRDAVRAIERSAWLDPLPPRCGAVMHELSPECMEKDLHFTLRIEGMTCDGCAQHVIQALNGVPGVKTAEVGDWRAGTAAVVAGGSVTGEALASAVAKAGYRAVTQAKRSLSTS